MPWSTLFSRRVVFDAIEMTDWRMYVETFPDGTHNFPRFTPRNPRGPSAWTTTLQYVRASRGEFTYADHGTPWSVVTRNLDVTVARPNTEYRGQASFSNGTVAIQNYVPMRADMQTTFRIVGGKVVLDRIDLKTDGAESLLTGQVDLTRWPEQLYHVRSKVNLPRMREIFFADDDFTLSGESDFNGTFHLFRETVNGRSRTGRELKGNFYSALAGVNAYRFSDLRGSVRLGAGKPGGHQRDGGAVRRRGAFQLPPGAARAARRPRDRHLRRRVRQRRPDRVHELPGAAGDSARRARDRTQPARMAAGTFLRTSRRGQHPHRP